MKDLVQAAGERPLRRIMLVIAYDGTNYAAGRCGPMGSVSSRCSSQLLKT